jgi:imidazolonepropionase-like amidohydrolase
MGYLFDNCRVFDGEREMPTETGSVAVENDRIVEVSDKPIRSTVLETVDCGGRVLMPGLIDAHIHACTPTFNFFRNDHMPASLLANHAAEILTGMLRRGFTTVRDAGGADRGLWLAIEAGLIAGPRLQYSGKGISQTGGHGDMRPLDEVQACGCGGYSGSISIVADGADAVRAAAREELRQGAHQIKIFASGGVCSPSDPIWMNQFTADEIEAAVYEARNHRSYVMAHCHTDESARRCVALGVRSIEHGSDISDETAQLIAEKGAFVVPTLAVTHVLRAHGPELGLPPMSLEKIHSLYDRILAAIERCTLAGVKLGLGADLLDSRYHSLQGMELVLRGEVNTPLEVLRSATSVNAELLQMPGEIGCIRAGALADIIVLDFDPFERLDPFEHAERTIPLVMKGGHIVRDTLRRSPR